MSGDICADDRFKLISEAKSKLLDATNIESNQTDMAALDSILFRCWQMGWLDNLRTCHIEHPYYGDAPVINGQPRCSECKTEFSVGTFPNYCPNCGAKVIA